MPLLVAKFIPVSRIRPGSPRLSVPDFGLQSSLVHLSRAGFSPFHFKSGQLNSAKPKLGSGPARQSLSHLEVLCLASLDSLLYLSRPTVISFRAANKQNDELVSRTQRAALIWACRGERAQNKHGPTTFSLRADDGNQEDGSPTWL